MSVKQTILVVDDNYGHAKLIMKNLRRSGLKNQMVHADNGKEALDYILGQGKFKGEEHINNVIMLLDLNMPTISGSKLINVLRKNLKDLPPTILYTKMEEDKLKMMCDVLRGAARV